MLDQVQADALQNRPEISAEIGKDESTFRANGVTVILGRQDVLHPTGVELRSHYAFREVGALRDSKDVRPSRAKDAGRFGEAAHRVRHVLHNILANYQIKTIISESQLCQVFAAHAAGTHGAERNTVEIFRNRETRLAAQRLGHSADKPKFMDAKVRPPARQLG